MTTFWDTDTFRDYERLCGDAPGTRARILASADWQTRVVDLSLSEAELWRGVRKSYHSLIHKAEREYYAEWCFEDECAADLMCGMHRAVAGRETRPKATWDLMGQWLGGGNGLAVIRGTSMKPLGYVYCVVCGRWAYYFSGVTVEPNLNHALLWHAMKALKARGVRYFELGWMDRPGDREKDKGIAQFKRGFGGFDIPAKEAPCLV